jgi:hypothetical protein
VEFGTATITPTTRSLPLSLVQQVHFARHLPAVDLAAAAQLLEQVRLVAQAQQRLALAQGLAVLVAHVSPEQSQRFLVQM